MRTALLFLALAPGCLFGADCAVARAEDFTGFYAGVNAGYAFGRGSDRLANPSDVRSAMSDRGRDDHNLPPSAANASRAMQDTRPRTSPPLR